MRTQLTWSFLLFTACNGGADDTACTATFDPAFLMPTPRPQILARVLANLAGVYRTVLADRIDELVAHGARSMRQLTDGVATARVVLHFP